MSIGYTEIQIDNQQNYDWQDETYTDCFQRYGSVSCFRFQKAFKALRLWGHLGIVHMPAIGRVAEKKVLSL